MKILISLATITTLTLVPLTYVSGAPAPRIRVKVIDDSPSVTIQSQGGALHIVTDTGRARERMGATARIAADRRGIVLKGMDRGHKLTLENKSGRYRIENRTFKGTLTIIFKDEGSLYVVNTLSLEDYLAGLINSEISSSWPVEAIKAQAVAARTYAMNQIEDAKASLEKNEFDITSTMLDQVYDGTALEDTRSRKAVSATRGELLLRAGSIFASYYHSCCGGRTEHAHNVWPGKKGPPVIEDKYCSRSPKFFWSYEISISQFIETMAQEGVEIKKVRTLATSPLTDSPRVGELLIEDEDTLHMIKATNLRRIFGYQNLKSTWFEVGAKNGGLIFTGQGYGHGVGMCQWGAKGMAEEGETYRDILKFYYPDAAIVKLY